MHIDNLICGGPALLAGKIGLRVSLRPRKIYLYTVSQKTSPTLSIVTSKKVIKFY